MQPSLEEVKRLRSQGNVIPVYKSVIADFLTPVSAFLKLEKDRLHAFLLESVEGGETIARYSFLGGDPFLITRYRDGKPADFMENLRATMSRFKSVKLPNLPPFTGGAVGYFGYDMVRTIEDIPKSGVAVHSNFEKKHYLASVQKAKEYIAAGDIFQVVLSQRFEVDLPTPPFEIYRALRIVNPSPYMYFLKMPDTSIVGSSPEMLVRVRERQLEYRPIAGTLPRGATDA